jgi:hypothetical protein
MERSPLQVDSYCEFSWGILSQSNIIKPLKVLKSAKTEITFRLEASRNAFNQV